MSEPPAEPQADPTPTAYEQAQLDDIPHDALEAERKAPDDEPGELEAEPGAPEAEPGGLERKPFIEHLRDLRVVLIKTAVVFLACVIVSFAALGPIFRFLRMPLRALEVRRGLEPGTIELITLGPSDVFNALMTISLSVAVGLSLPFALYFLGGFVAPALTRRERRALVPGLIAGLVLFVAGAAFAFFITSGLLMDFLWSLGEGMRWPNQWTAGAYFGFLSRFVFVSGLSFELPLVLVILVRLGVLTIRMLNKYRRHAIMVILVVAAVLTPPDATSMFIVAGPMYLLYELSIVASIILERRRRRRPTSEPA
jgi:sec-independent protein translocase protein TatC